jgi:hypothetical protein
MNLDDVKAGMFVKTVERLGGTSGMLIHPKHLSARRPNGIGVVWGWVPGHGGDVWLVRHPDDEIGAYVYDEFEPFTDEGQCLAHAPHSPYNGEA